MAGTEKAETPEIIESEKAYQKFLPQALAITEGDIAVFRADAVLAYHNLKRGVMAVMEQTSQVAPEGLPAVRWSELAEAVELGQAVVFAASQVNRFTESQHRIDDLLGKAYPLRRQLLATAVALAEVGIVPQAGVDAIIAGQGKLDAAADCVALAALFRRHAAAVENKSPVTPAMIDQAAQLGSELLTLLKPAGAARERAIPKETAAAVDARDRLWTLLVERHDTLWRVGAWIWGRDVEEHVPPLQSRRRVRAAQPA